MTTYWIGFGLSWHWLWGWHPGDSEFETIFCIGPLQLVYWKH